MTGLALAYYAGRAGHRTTIIEKGSELSGLLAFTHVGDVPIERFYHHFFTPDQYFLSLLDELGLSDKILWRPGASAILYDDQLFPFITKTDYLRLPWLSWKAKLRAATAALRLRSQLAEKISSSLTAETYLRRLFGQEGWAKMWQTLLVNKFGAVDGPKISAQWIARRIQIRSSSERNGREVLGYVQGSYKVLFDRLRQAIEDQGGQIMLNCEVSSLPRTSDGKYLINGQEFDVVVSTIAPHLIKKIVPELDVPKVTYRGAIVPLLWLRSSPTPYYWMNVLDTNLPFSVIVNQQALLPKNYYHGLHPLYIGHYVADTSELFEKSNEELYEYYLPYLQKIFPGIEKEVVGYEISRTKFAQPVVTAPWTPLSHTTSRRNFYVTSMAHIFPEDRGANYAIREAQRVLELIE